MRAVKSSAISHIGYDDATRVLTVRWTHGAESRYADVPVHMNAALGRADSVGTFVKSHIVGKFKLHEEKKE